MTRDITCTLYDPGHGADPGHGIQGQMLYGMCVIYEDMEALPPLNFMTHQKEWFMNPTSILMNIKTIS